MDLPAISMHDADPQQDQQQQSSLVSSNAKPARPSIGSRSSTEDRLRPTLNSIDHNPQQNVYESSSAGLGQHPSASTTSIAQSQAPSSTAGYSSTAASSSKQQQQQPMPNIVHQIASPSMSTFPMGSQQLGSSANAEVVPTTFDEATLRVLCDTDVGLPLLYERIKQSMNSCREAATFFKKRAAIEEEYGRTLQKLAKTSLDSYGSSDGKAGSYVSSYHSILASHEPLAESRLRLAQRLNEMSDELTTLVKEIDRSRKGAKETGTRLERNLLDAESGVEKAKSRFDSAAEELERILLLKSGESGKGGDLAASHAASGSISGSAGGHGGGTSSGGQNLAHKGRSLGKAMTKGGMLFKNNKNPQQLQRQEDDVRLRTSQLSDTFRREVLQTQQMRQEFFALQLPRILRSLKESAEEIDNGLQYHLSRYAYLYESTVLADGMTISPQGAAATQDGAVGLKHAAESIDNRSDFRTYMQNYQVLHARDYKGPRREGPYSEGFLPSNASGGSHVNGLGSTPSQGSQNQNGAQSASRRPIFGVDLATQMARDNLEVPAILEKCGAAVEAFGRENMGIYRLSGTTSKVQRLKAKFDTDWEAVDLFDDAEALSDINIVSGCLKLWFRELPEPLLTWELYRGFIEAAKVENDRLRHIRLHEVVNQLPDANYSTLKALMGHLDRIRAAESLNQMSASNIAIVFGPTLLGPPPPGMVFEGQSAASEADESSQFHSRNGDTTGAAAADESVSAAVASGAPGSSALADMAFQSKAVETILIHYRDIFLEDDEVAEGHDEAGGHEQESMSHGGGLGIEQQR